MEGHIFLGVLVVVSTVVVISGEASKATHVSGEASKATYGIDSLNRSSFPKGFVFGVATSAYQVEGGANQGGRGPSIWDTFTQKYPGKIKNGDNGNVACDSYHLYKEDVKIMKEMGVDAYRFSISWSRILPNGKLSGGVNKEGIRYYNNLINELLANKLQPFVTLFHWDLPQALEDEYGGFLNPKVAADFGDYVDICFREFGDRVKHWITLNEPLTYSVTGYASGAFAPGRCSSWQKLNCLGGDSGTEPYLVSHHQLLAHAVAVQLYRNKYQASQKGKIGITLVSSWTVPFSDTKEDHHAALRALDFMFGWFMAPLTTGDYPRTMRSLVGNRLPKFSEEQSKMLKGSYDFLGLNYYSANYAAHAPNDKSAIKVNPSFNTDGQVRLSTERNGIPIGAKSASDWLLVYPSGIRDLLLYVKKHYNNPLIYITENGIDEVNNSTLTLEEALVDNQRINYYHDHLAFIQKAIKEGVNVKGFFGWALIDNFEWASGYTVRFGINFVDFKDGFKRYPKVSAKWFKNFLQK